MIQKTYTQALALILGPAALLIFSCHNIDDSSPISEVNPGPQVLQAPTTPHNEPTVDIAKEAPVAASIAPVEIAVPVEPVVAPIPDFSLSPDDPMLAPWRAMYANSYGLLPTRFQDKGPFLYSFDVDPDAAASPDNNLGPLEFFDHSDDDDDF